jgi:hypothetical protein
MLVGLCWPLVCPSRSSAAVNPTSSSDTFYVSGSTRKICQLVGDTDFQWLTPTENLTQSRAGFYGTDLGVPFVHNGLTYVVFGDTWGGLSGDRDPIAFTADTDPEDGIALTFYTDGSVFHPITVPGIAQGAYNVPLDGVSVSNKMYLYHTTDHSASVTMGRSVVAVSTNNGWTFRLLYTLSRTNFINVSVSKVNLADWPGFPQSSGDGLVIFGSGAYRASNVRLAFQPAAEIESASALRYFAGLDEAGNPTWSTEESASIDLFDQPVVGELSVAYNKFIRRWVMFYNSSSPRGINFRTARQPWGPWSGTQVLLDPWAGAYGQYFHIDWNWWVGDNAQNPGREYEFGGEYGPYMFKELATGSDNRTTIYFTMSSWNPYVSLLMRTDLQVTNSPVITRPPTDQKVMAGQSATFELTASAVGTLNYNWAKNGSVIAGATRNTLVLSNVSSADNGAQFRCRAANSIGAVTSSPVYLTVVSANQAPAPQILSPSAGASYAGGETVSFFGAASDPEDGALPDSSLRWNVLFCHGSHNVPFLGTLGGVPTGAFSVPIRGETSTNVFFRIYLTARDSGGREATVFRDVIPRASTLSLQTEPAGLSLTLNGQTFVTPTNLAGVVGSSCSLGIVGPARLAGRDYDFMGWSDGGAAGHVITLPETNLTLKAFFRTPTVIVSTNATWKYLVAGSAPPSTWNSVDFNDASWPSGPAQLGYGDGDEATTIGWGPDSNNRYVTTWFRRSFSLDDPSVFASLLVRLLRDDGGAVYLNGTEVFRSNLGGGAPIYRMLAPAAALPADETSFYYSTNLSPSLLRAGPNVIAVEIHQNTVNNTADLSFALELRAVEFDPRLSVARAGANLALTWPAPSAGYLLESTPALAANSSWTLVNPPPVLTNGHNLILLPASIDPQFFRLRKP